MPKIKVYCDRLSEVIVDKKGTIECPKCRGVAPYDKKMDMYDCLTCARRWQQVPMNLKTSSEAEEYLFKYRS